MNAKNKNTVERKTLDIEIYNLERCAEIGGIAGCNCHYTAGITKRIADTGKSIDDLTVRELIEIHKKYGAEFNSFYSF